MVLLMLAATIYGVVQMLVLAWPTRTVRLPTALLGIAVGVYACGALALALELASAHTLVATSDISLSEAIRRASYTVDPVIEELVKIVPLLLVGMNVRSRLQYGLADYVVLGAGLGAGFGLLEAVARFGMKADQAVPLAGGGWILPNLTPPYIPGIKQVLSTAFPAPVGTLDIADLTKLVTGLSPGTSIHLAWTALAGIGVGLMMRGRRWARLLGLLPISIACCLHTAHNYVAVKPQAAVSPFASAVESQLWLVPLITLAIAMAIDLKTLRWAKAVVPGVLLAGEGPGISALFRFSVTAPPWTSWIVLRFVPVRRSLWYFAARSTPTAVEPMRQVVSGLAAEMTVAGHKQAWLGLPIRELLLAAGRWKRRLVQIFVAVALAVPALLVVVIGSFPSHAGLQKSLTIGHGAVVMFGFAVGGLV
jgi:RsiW-degrading membrane proteinase PrsW (M82 family)